MLRLLYPSCAIAANIAAEGTVTGNKEGSLLDAGRMVRDHRASTSEGSDHRGAMIT